MDNDPNTVIYNISVYYEKLDVMLCVEKKSWIRERVVLTPD